MRKTGTTAKPRGLNALHKEVKSLRHAAATIPARQESNDSEHESTDTLLTPLNAVTNSDALEMQTGGKQKCAKAIDPRQAPATRKTKC